MRHAWQNLVTWGTMFVGMLDLASLVADFAAALMIIDECTPVVRASVHRDRQDRSIASSKIVIGDRLRPESQD